MISSAGQLDSSLAVTSTIVNRNSGATTALRVTATLSIVTGAFDPAFTPGASAAGYTLVSGTNTSGNTATFVFDADSELAGNTSVRFDPLLGLVGQGPFSGTLLVSADPGVGTPGTSTRTFG